MDRLILHIEGNIQVVFVDRGRMGVTIKVEDTSIVWTKGGKKFYEVISIGISQSARDNCKYLQKGCELAHRYDLFSAKPTYPTNHLGKQQEWAAMEGRCFKTCLKHSYLGR